MNKLAITRAYGRLLTALISDQGVLELGFEEESSVLGNIYIGKVKKVIKNLNSAFVDFADGQTGYYSLTDNPVHWYMHPKKGGLAAGDEIIVQVAKDAVKSKDPVLSANLNFTGTYAVVTAANPVVGFSAKISDRTWKEALRPQLEDLTGGTVGVVVRTNAYGQDEALLREVAALLQTYRHLMEVAPYRTCYTLLFQAQPDYLKTFQGCPRGSLDEVVTDDETVFETMQSYLSAKASKEQVALRFYQDPLVPLGQLYGLKTVLSQATQKRVWLKSGGYLVIEPTEAMVVVDVNSGKYSGHKALDATIRLVNREAAVEICRQLRLRNLSGIIMIDFIDMKEEEDRAQLLGLLRELALHDPVKTAVVDMTALGLVEMTRKKGKKPLYEQLAAIHKND